ncbi:outer membrane protein assembly factor BamD [bacterium]|nr:outer membrane protein assembly factor BamD [bacterium]
MRQSLFLRAVLVVATLGIAGTCMAAQDGDLAAAKAAFDRKQFDKAESLARDIVEEKGQTGEGVAAWLVMTDSLMMMRNFPVAFQECENLLAAHPDTKHRSAILRREFEIGKTVAFSHAMVLLFRLSKHEEGVAMLEVVIKHAPYGPLADQSIMMIAEAYYARKDFGAAHDHFDRLLRFYPDSKLIVKARVRRALCSMEMAEGAEYDPTPAEEAEADLNLLAKISQDKSVEARAAEMRELMAHKDYDAGLYYFRCKNIEGGLRYMESVIRKYPTTEHAERARRILRESIIGQFPQSTHAKRARRFLDEQDAARAKEKL